MVDANYLSFYWLTIKIDVSLRTDNAVRLRIQSYNFKLHRANIAVHLEQVTDVNRSVSLVKIRL